MEKKSVPDLSLFLDVLNKLETISIPYVIIGGFAATIYGITRSTYDIDIIVDLNEQHIQALAAAYPLPRYYADPYQMSYAMKQGSMFNIIDTDRGEKADLVPITMDERYRPAFEKRIRQTIQPAGVKPFSVWLARPEDVIVGKLMAWTELQSDRHEWDIYEMMVAHYAQRDPVNVPFDEEFVNNQAKLLGEKTHALWEGIKIIARQDAEQLQV